MGIKNYKKDFNKGRQKEIDESSRRRKQEEKINIPLELVEPNRGKYITLKLTKEHEILRGIYRWQLNAYATSIRNSYPDAVVTVYEDRVTMKMRREEDANKIRTLWENSL